jgi:lipoprotein-anchoring transpeptidase ErfK/SrfK
VRIAGVRVGGLDATQATKAVTQAFARPLPVVVDGITVQLPPAKVATAYVAGAVAHAASASAGTNIKLTVSVHGTAVRAAVARIAARVDTKAQVARLSLVQGKPHVVVAKNGQRLDQSALVSKIVKALTSNVRLSVRGTTSAVQARANATTGAVVSSVILVNRAQNKLFLFNKNTLVHTFAVASGQAIYPTPAGRFQIVVKWKNPTWYPPTQDAWAKGLVPVPPGPNNPLGTRWMGLDSPGIGIHGTDEPGSIGYSESHGCIRMQVADAEWLFDHVQVGTTVFIV